MMVSKEKENLNNKTKLKTGDLVKVITGKWKGTIDYISRVEPKKQTVYLKKVVKKVYKKNNKKTELKEIMIPLSVSNVLYWLKEKGMATRIGFREIDNKKIRISRKCNVTLI